MEQTKTTATYYRLAVGVALGTALFLVWSIGALGIIGAGGRPDRMYVAVLGVAAVGTVLARLRPRGMALALLATAATPLVIAVVALAAGLHRTEGAGVLEILGLNAMFATMFAVSAWLFWRASEAGQAPAWRAR